MAVKGIIFDLDGTLVDTLDDLTDSMNYALAAMGLHTHPARDCREMIGNGLTTFARRALGPEHLDRQETLLEIMTQHYRGNCLNKTRVYDGLAETLRQLQAQTIRLAVLTNKNQQPAEVIVRHYFGADTFNPILGYLPQRAVKPDPGGLFEILDIWKMPPEEVLLVGDSEADVETAARAAVGFIGCLWGFRTEKQLTEAGAKTLIDKPEDLLPYL